MHFDSGGEDGGREDGDRVWEGNVYRCLGGEAFREDPGTGIVNNEGTS